jgi:hypothetical protein
LWVHTYIHNTFIELAFCSKKQLQCTQNYETEIVPEELVWNFHPKLPIRIKTSERFMREIRMKDWFAKIAALLHLIQSENDWQDNIYNFCSCMLPKQEKKHLSILTELVQACIQKSIGLNLPNDVLTSYWVRWY